MAMNLPVVRIVISIIVYAGLTVIYKKAIKKQRVDKNGDFAANQNLFSCNR